MSKKRTPHKLNHNSRVFNPYHFIFFDTETTTQKLSPVAREHNFRLGVASYFRPPRDGRPKKQTWFEFKSIPRFWDFVFDSTLKKRPLYLIAHNISFDARILHFTGYLWNRGYETEFFLNNQTTAIWSFKKDDRKIYFLDNMNFFPYALDTLGKGLGFKKGKMPDFDAKDKLWFKYCRRDVEVMIYAWRKLRNYIIENDLGSFKKTAASTSMAIFRHRFLDQNIFIHTNKKAVDLERDSYKGGRTECFYIGELKNDTYRSLDINSMYPAVMKKYEYPYKLIGRGENIKIPELKKHLKTHSIIARVKIETPVPVFGYHFNDHLCFPVGRFTPTLTSEELKLALANGWIIEVEEANLYKKAPVFEQFVDGLYTKRLQYRDEGNRPFALLSKLFLNSLYGKFGQKNPIWEKIDEAETPDLYSWKVWDIDQQKMRHGRQIGKIIEEKVGDEEAYNSQVAICSEVTANARLLLWNLIQEAGFENTFYCDTDSLFVNRAGFFNLKSRIDPDKLGALKVEKTAQDLVLFAPKWYRLGSKVKHKGIKDNAKRIGPNVYTQHHFESLKGAMNNRRPNRVIVKEVKKELSKTYKKGRIKSDGQVRPYKLNEF